MAKSKKTQATAGTQTRRRRPARKRADSRDAEDRPAGGAAEDQAADADRDGDAEAVEVEVLDGEGPDDDALAADLVDQEADEHGIALIDTSDVELEIAERSDSGRSLARFDPMAAYMAEVRRRPLLSREEEHELAVRVAEDGDADAARRLIEANLRLVVKIAYEYRRAYRNILDLVQEGNVGLLQAVKKFDPHRGVKLSTYAAWWIRAYILKFILNNWRLVKIGTTQAQRKLFFNLRREREKLEQLGFQPDIKLLAERLQVSEKDVDEMQKRLAAPDASLDAPMGGDDDGPGRTRMDLIEDGVATPPDVAATRAQFQSMLREKLSVFAEGLTGRDEMIFRRRWLTDEPLTLQQIGDEYGISRERARQIEKRLMDRLRVYLEKEFGGEVDISALGGE